MSSKAKAYIDHILSIGRISFTLKQMENDLAVTYKAACRMLERLQQNKEIVSVARGYYLILTPEFRSLGCLPPNYFIDDLMQYWAKAYYVGLLSAAMFHGAAHQQPQSFQVMLKRAKPNISRGRVFVEFIQNSFCEKVPTQSFKTPSGNLMVSTPEVTAIELIKFMRQSGGVNRVVTVLHELGEKVKAQSLVELTTVYKDTAWIQRLGYILEFLGYQSIAKKLLVYLKTKSIRTVPLVPYLKYKKSEKNDKWRLFINTKIESDLGDIE
jgi:predicted transcriptional regulator of viral defense system